MKTPFRFQASDYDCVPTTFINAISYLFERSEIPPLVIQRIFTYCLDSISSQQNLGHGTTSYAVQLMGNFLSEFQEKGFKVCTEYICDERVHLGRNNKIARTLNAGGAALLNVKSIGNDWHYVLALEIDANWLYIFDPYPKKNYKKFGDKFVYVKQEFPQGPNLHVRREWLDSKNNSELNSLGPIKTREALLLWRADA